MSVVHVWQGPKKSVPVLATRRCNTRDELPDRRAWAREEAASLRARRRDAARSVVQQPGKVRLYVLADALNKTLEKFGGGLVTIEQFAVSQDNLENTGDAGNNEYIRPAGGSEGYGMGAAIGAKLGASEKPVVGLVGDGSLYYSDSALWTAAGHGIPVLYIISNNVAYGIIAGAFGGADAEMKQTGEYRGVILNNIDPVKLAEGFGVEVCTPPTNQISPGLSNTALKRWKKRSVLAC